MARKEMASVPEEEEWLDECGIEAVEAMIELTKAQQQLAMDLTRLVLEHCKEDPMTKDRVFSIFEEAFAFMMKRIKSYTLNT
jgi:hypothetical protein